MTTLAPATTTPSWPTTDPLMLPLISSPLSCPRVPRRWPPHARMRRPSRGRRDYQSIVADTLSLGRDAAAAPTLLQSCRFWNTGAVTRVAELPLLAP